MSEQRPLPSPAVVGPHEPVTPSTLARAENDRDGFEARCGLLTDLHLSSLVKILEEMDAPHTTQTMARIAVLRLIPYMSGEEAELVLKALARQVVEGRRNESRAK